MDNAASRLDSALNSTLHKAHLDKGRIECIGPCHWRVWDRKGRYAVEAFVEPEYMLRLLDSDDTIPLVFHIARLGDCSNTELRKLNGAEHARR